MKVWIAIALMWIGLFFTIQALTFAQTHPPTLVIPKHFPPNWPQRDIPPGTFMGDNKIDFYAHFRCEAEQMNPAHITLYPIDGGPLVTFLCTNCSCGADK